MTIDAVIINNVVSKQNIPTPDRTRVVAYAAAVSVAYQLPLPPAPVQSPRLYYTEQALAQARNIISDLNEATVFDIQGAIESTYKFWLGRYQTAHGTPMSGVPTYDFFCQLHGVTEVWSEDEYAFVNANASKIFPIIAVFNNSKG